MELVPVIGNSLSEDDSNPIGDVFTFEEPDGEKLSLIYMTLSSLSRFYAQNYLTLQTHINVIRLRKCF